MPPVRRAAAALAAALLLVACDTAVSPAPATPVLPAATATVAATAAPSPPSTATIVPPPATATPAGDGQIDTKALYHMSRDPAYRSPGGAVPAGTTVTLRLRAAPGDLTGADVRTFDTRTNADQTLPMRLEQQTPEGDLWRADVTTPSTPGLFTYRFVAHDGAKTVVYQDDAAHDGGTGEARALPGMNDYTINAYDPHWTIPAWMQDAVIYQIFPDRFDNGDPGNDRPAGQVVYDSVTTQSAWGAKPQGSYDFFGGDLQGVIDKLDYLQSLGVTVIYFNPIFVAASNHGYDTQDYLHIAPWFGDQATFDRLIAETQKRGMHVILDGVFNHVSSDSPWFDRYSHFPTLGAYEFEGFALLLLVPLQRLAGFLLRLQQLRQPAPAAGDRPGARFHLPHARFGRPALAGGGRGGLAARRRPGQDRPLVARLPHGPARHLP